MPAASSVSPTILDKTLSIVMGGGAGTRLFPLTAERAKPAVPLAGKYRLVDIPISNCINAGLRKIYVLTQYNSTSLHRHINSAYKFDHFSRSFVHILAAQQTPDDKTWYQGTADAVRQNLGDFLHHDYQYYIILSGDQLYNMDFQDLLGKHIESGAELTIATLPVGRNDAEGFGILQTDADQRITRFVEKPKDPALLDTLRMPEKLLAKLGKPTDTELFQASMGIYVFNRETLIRALDNNHVDFGKNVIPELIGNARVNAYIFEGYWEDIGTIRSFFEANLALTDVIPPFNFFDTRAPIYTHARYLPATKINGASIKQAVISDGCVISDAHIERSVIGIRSFIESNSTIRNSIVMGADFYEADQATRGTVKLGIGRNCVIDRAIIDKNARIGDGAVITPNGKPDNFDGDGFYIRDGIVIIPKGGVIADGRWI